MPEDGDAERLWQEVRLLRTKVHQHSSLLTAHALIIRIACAISAIVGSMIGAALVKIIWG